MSQPISVTASETSSLNVTLTVAQANTNVVVEGAAETADLESSTLGALWMRRRSGRWPLSSRNYTQILGLAPGVVVDLPAATALGNGTQNVASNGATATNNNLQFNGVDANNLYENSAANAESSIVGTAIPATGYDSGVPSANGQLRRRIRTWDGSERRSGQQERDQQFSRKRMGVFA
ncbi:MAG: hypothetical protein WDM87_17720 [Terracidiphilus sp.]